MAGYYERPQSSAALWCLRLAVFTAPFLLLAILLHRSGAVTTPQVFWLIAVGIALILAALLFGLKAAFDLWEKGYQGGRATVNGIVVATLLLVPFGFQFLNVLEHPQLNDVATDVVAPPRIAIADQEADRPVYDDFVARLIVTSYPELVARRYEAPPERVVASVLDLLDRRGWNRIADANIPLQVLESRSAAAQTDGLPAEADGTASDDGDTSQGGELAGDEGEIEQLETGFRQQSGSIPDILIEARALSRIMKLPSTVTIRLRDDNGNTLVDMRSASTWGPHDFGSNAGNIAAFLASLDEELAGLAGER